MENKPEKESEKEPVTLESLYVQAEALRRSLLGLSDSVGIIVNAVQQLSLNLNSVESYIAEEVQKITREEYEKKIEPIRVKLLTDLTKQVQEKSTLKEMLGQKEGGKKKPETEGHA